MYMSKVIMLLSLGYLNRGGSPKKPDMALIKSPTRQYKLCTVVSSSKDVGVYRAVLLTKDQNPSTVCDAGGLPTVIVKCGDSHLTDPFMSEFQEMLSMRGAPWGRAPIETFIADRGPCISMEDVGVSVRSIRDASGAKQVWDPVAVASIGIQLLDMLKVVHFVHQKANIDLSPDLVALKLDSSSQTVLSSYEGIHSIASPSSQTRLWLIRDLQQLAFSLRFLHDGDSSFSALLASPEDALPSVCPWTLHRELCAFVSYALGLDQTVPPSGAVSAVHYENMRNHLVQVLTEAREVYGGSVIWGSVVVPQDLLARQRAAEFKLIARPATVATTPVADSVPNFHDLLAETTTKNAGDVGMVVGSTCILILAIVAL